MKYLGVKDKFILLDGAFVLPNTQSKSVFPTHTSQIITPDEGYIGLDKVTIEGIYAIISVSYPEGSTCTCSNSDGSIVFTSENTRGSAIFSIPSSGTWTVRCYTGSDYDSSENKKSEVVEITTEKQIESIELMYRYDILRNGKFASELGNLTKTSLVSFSDGIIKGTYNSEVCAAFSFTNKLVIPKLFTLNMRFKQSNVGYCNQSLGFTFGLSTNNSLPNYYANYSFDAKKQITSTVSNYTTYSLDIQSFIGQNVFIKATAAADYSVDQIWLE